MKSFLLTLSFILFTIVYSHAQTGREVDGTVIDSTKLSLPGSFVTVTSEIQGDSVTTATDNNGKFTFPSVKGKKITLSISSIGYQAIRKHFALDNDTKPVVLPPIILQTESNVLKQVNVNGVAPVTFKEDTTEYKASAYKVRDNAPIEDVIKKLPGVDVDVNGNITTQGKQVTKVRLNGKDYMAGDVQSLTKNLPADVVENIQMIDDYGDQANLTGVKTGEPDKIMNITIRADKNHGYSAQGTVGDGEDLLPQSQGIPDANRYIGSLNSYVFNNNQIIAVTGSLNNTNVNTFNFGSTTGGGGGGATGGFGGGIGGGGGRGNAARGMQNSSSLTTSANGITDARSIGVDFRDQWGKYISVYGSYSFADNTVNTISTNNQQNNSLSNPSLNFQKSNETDQNINHRFTWNMEYKPDTINYLKITPTFSYASVNTNDNEGVTFSAENQTTQVFTPTSAYTSTSNGTSTSPTYGVNVLFNHRFPHRRNLSVYIIASSTTSNQFQNPVYNYTVGTPTAPTDQMIYTYSHTNSISSTLSYLEPLGKLSYLEFNYAFSRAVTTNDKETDVSDTTGISTNPYTTAFFPDSALSNDYHYTFTTNRFSLNYLFRNKVYNYVLGLGVQPSTLDGFSPATGNQTHVSDFNFVPTARFVYNFSRSHTLSFNYNGSSTAPTFTQLQPVIDFSNALYPVEGNPNLKPAFTNNISLRYNSFNFNSNTILFSRISYQQVDNYITTNTITYPRIYAANPKFQNTVFTKYLNTDGNGYSATSANLVFSKPWDSRKFTLSLTGSVTYSTTAGYLTNVTTADSITSKNISRNLQFTPGFKFMTDITNVIDAQFITSYAINKTTNTVQDSLNNSNSNIRTWSLETVGKNYFGDWTFSYDYAKTINYGYASSLKVTNPNLVSLYLERRFLKGNRGTLRLSVFDLFNQNAGYTSTQTVSSITTTSVNRLARYYLATFTLRLQKFAGKAPDQDPNMRGFRRNGGPGGPGGGPGGGGPGGGGPGGGPGGF